MGYKTSNNDTASSAASLFGNGNGSLAALLYSTAAGLSRTDSSFASLLWGGVECCHCCVGVELKEGTAGPR